ncbi:DUF3301 domain-containing protein [Thiolapillus brandeum]|uniref:DUF3301 domain-containing protein n=1 Tax=Thiolapillus brandeum TaxID=1076588 RepID=A0A7U6JHP1_9GAMM|nr:DUF3301 domain-containing protein [Thiolapillus brandeum]BAO43405.1 hypothetical protein TBH_C0460 [Thiolapillus brandeum]
MTSTLFAIFFLGLAVIFWMNAARARELAVGISRAACNRERYQLLDDSVYLQRVGLRWTPSGLRFRRMYRFDYSVNGSLRDSGYVLLIGNQLEAVHLQGKHTIEQELRKMDTESSSPTPDPHSHNVIPFPGKQRRHSDKYH